MLESTKKREPRIVTVYIKWYYTYWGFALLGIPLAFILSILLSTLEVPLTLAVIFAFAVGVAWALARRNHIIKEQKKYMEKHNAK